ncbi:MAG: DUF2004 domain-containing protein [Kineosporiaceae bacterium]
MEILVHDAFGKVEFDPEGDLNEWESEVPFAGGTVELDITFNGSAMDRATLDGLAKYVTDLARFDGVARAAMRVDLDDEDSAVRDYIDHHRGEKDLIRRVFDSDDGSAIAADAFLPALRLIRVGLYAGTEVSEHEAVLDYSIDPENVHYLVAVCFGEKGTVAEISMES